MFSESEPRTKFQRPWDQIVEELQYKVDKLSLYVNWVVQMTDMVEVELSYCSPFSCLCC